MRKFILGAAALYSLNGCSVASLRYPVAPAATEPAIEREATAIRFGQCASGQKQARIAPVVAAAAGMAVDFGVKLIEAGIKHLKGGRTAVWSAEGAMAHVDSGSLTKECAMLFRGVVVDQQALKEPPVFRLYADITFGAPVKVGDSMMRDVEVRPYKLEYAETSAPIKGKKGKDVTVILAFSGQTLSPQVNSGEVETKSASGVIRLEFGRLYPGKFYDDSLLSDIVGTTTIPVFRTTTVTAVVSESEKPSASLEALSAAFGSNKDKLSDALKEVVTDAIGVSEKK